MKHTTARIATLIVERISDIKNIINHMNKNPNSTSIAELNVLKTYLKRDMRELFGLDVYTTTEMRDTVEQQLDNLIESIFNEW